MTHAIAPVARAVLHSREMNQTEKEYSRYLDALLKAGEIKWWDFESWKVRLADNTWYTPDFIVVNNRTQIEAHEVKAYWKGRNGKPGHTGWHEDARVKIKVAAERHPVRFLAVTLMPDHSWQIEQFGEPHEERDPIVELIRAADALVTVKTWDEFKGALGLYGKLRAQVGAL